MRPWSALPAPRAGPSLLPCNSGAHSCPWGAPGQDSAASPAPGLLSHRFPRARGVGLLATRPHEETRGREVPWPCPGPFLPHRASRRCLLRPRSPRRHTGADVAQHGAASGLRSSGQLCGRHVTLPVRARLPARRPPGCAAAAARRPGRGTVPSAASCAWPGRSPPSPPRSASPPRTAPAAPRPTAQSPPALVRRTTEVLGSWDGGHDPRRRCSQGPRARTGPGLSPSCGCAPGAAPSDPLTA